MIVRTKNIISKKIMITILLSLIIHIIFIMIMDFIIITEINTYSDIILDFSHISKNAVLHKAYTNQIFSQPLEFNIIENHKFKLSGENIYDIDNIYDDHGKRIAFLTFDDGPSSHTDSILNILNEKNVKATFFVLGVSVNEYPELVLKIAKQGHGIGNHSYSHNISYWGDFTPDVFLSDILKNDNKLKSILGEGFKGNLVRFPGGNFYETQAEKIPYNAKLLQAGFRDIDWNIDSRDSSSFNPSREFILDNVKNQSEDKRTAVILMHDVSFKPNVVAALPEIIDYLKSVGFEFGIINSYQ